MRKLVLLLLMASCGISQMNDSIQTSSSTIQENTREVSRSTQTMQSFEKVITENTVAVTKLIEHPFAATFGFALIIALLVLPSVLLIALYFKPRRRR